MQRFATWMAGMAMALVAAGCGGDGTGRGGISPTGPLFVGSTKSVTVNCPSQMEKGTSSTCNAFGYDSVGTFTNSVESSWSSSNTSVATISSTGGIAAVGVGTTSISAVIDGITGSTSVTVVPAPLSVTLNGPSSVWPNADCYWWANAAGGTPGYSYSWSGGSNGVADGSTYYAYAPSSGPFTIAVTVTDANGGTASASKQVTVSSRAFACP